MGISLLRDIIKFTYITFRDFFGRIFKLIFSDFFFVGLDLDYLYIYKNIFTKEYLLDDQNFVQTL
jgi:hypothetical protein